MSYSTNNKTILTLILLLFIASASYLPFVYENAFGEGDSYRMASGFLESLSSGKLFVSSISYYPNRISFGYYAFLYFFEDTLKSDPTLLFPLMNYTNAICSILVIIPFFYIMKKYFGYAAAVIANLVLIALPVWREISLYGHPQTPALLFLLTGLSLLAYRSHLASIKSHKGVLFTCDIIIVTVFILSMSIRADLLLLFPLIIACLLLEGRPWQSALRHFILYSVLSVLIYYIILSQIPENFDTLSVFLAPKDLLVRSIHKFMPSTIYFFKAYPPFLLTGFIITCLTLLYYRKYNAFAFLFPVVLINYLFYMPSPGHNGRHFHFIAPIIAAGIGILLSTVIERFKSSRPTGFTVTGLFTVLIIFILSFYIDYRLLSFHYYKNMYSEEQAQKQGELYKDLMQLDPHDKPVFVVSDARPVFLNMQMRAGKIKIVRKDQLFHVNTDRNEFVFIKEGYYKSQVMDLREEADLRGTVYWIIDPYNSNIYARPFNDQAPSPHIQILLSRAET